MTDTTADAAMAALQAQMDVKATARVLGYLQRIVPQTLGVPADNVVITIAPGDDMVGIAVMNGDGCGAATSGSKAAALADLKQWTADRCAELTTGVQAEVTRMAAEKAAAATVTATKAAL